MTAQNRLLSLLESQREVCLRLLELVREERTCLMYSRLERLDAIVEEQAELLAQQEASSARVQRALERLATALQVDGPVSLSGMAVHLPPEVAEPVRAYHRELTTLTRDLQREGRINWHLAQQALTYVDFTLKVIGRAQTGSQTYATPGQSGAHAVRLLMDQSA